MSYIVYQLYGVYIFCIVFFAFVFISWFCMESSINKAMKKINQLKDKIFLEKILFILLVSGVLIYSTFVFRVNVLYLTGLFLHVGFDWLYIYVMCGVFTLSSSFFGLLLLIDLFERVKVFFQNIWSIKTLCLIPSYFIAEVVVSMLWRGAAGFGQVFSGCSVINISIYLEVLLLIFVMLVVFDFLQGALGNISSFISKDNEIGVLDLFVFCCIIIKSWATGVGMKSLTGVKFVSANILGFFMGFTQDVANLDNSRCCSESFALPGLLFADIATCMVAINFIPLASVVMVNAAVCLGASTLIASGKSDISR